jgi:dTDP-D-glucose 4,6-dehydratase
MIPLFITNWIDGLKAPLYWGGLNVRDWLHVMITVMGLIWLQRRVKLAAPRW